MPPPPSTALTTHTTHTTDPTTLKRRYGACIALHEPKVAALTPSVLYQHQQQHQHQQQQQQHQHQIILN
jgi:hypothetical protein